MSNYIYGLDLSLSNTGVTIFDGETPVFVGSIPTNPKDEHGKRLKEIYSFLSLLKDKYPPSVVCIERGFTRFNKATQALYKVVGCVNLLFCDIEQIYYSPNEVKATLANGKATKEEVASAVEKLFPNCKFRNNDESDSFAIAITHLIKTGVIKERE